MILLLAVIKSKARRFVFPGCFVVGCSSSALADGFPIRDGHFTVPVTTLELTSQQLQMIPKNRMTIQQIRLMEEQRVYLSVETGKVLRSLPTVIEIFYPEAVKDDCSCGAANVGLLVGGSQLEVAKEFLMSDEEAQAKKIED